MPPDPRSQDALRSLLLGAVRASEHKATIDQPNHFRSDALLQQCLCQGMH